MHNNTKPQKDDLRRALIDQQEEFSRRSKDPALVSRDISARLQSQAIKAPDLIKAILGIRRCGKSTLCTQLLSKEEIIYFNLDDERLIQLNARDLQDLLEAGLSLKPQAKTLFFDEIQNIPGWELFINRLQRSGYKVWITGSNAHLLSKELATHLTGRTLSFEVSPFSFVEWLRLKGREDLLDSIISPSTETRASVFRLFMEYFANGGFPEVAKGADRNQYLQTLFDQIISRDIVLRHNVRQPRELKELALMLVNSAGTRISHQNLSRNLSIHSAHTIKKYLGYIEEAYLAFELRNQTLKLKDRSKKPRKIYLIDLGLIEALSLKWSPDHGHRLENLVYLHLKRLGHEPSCWSERDFEIDFVIQSGRETTHLIQVCYSLSDERTLARELSALGKGLKNAKKAEALIITWDEERIFGTGENTIRAIPVWLFLLNGL